MKFLALESELAQLALGVCLLSTPEYPILAADKGIGRLSTVNNLEDRLIFFLRL